MRVKDKILQEIEKVPEPYLEDLLLFVQSLEARALEEGAGTAIASETSLAKDWLAPEEDEAWRHL